jgi:phosphate starvation-inducible protein PhoH
LARKNETTVNVPANLNGNPFWGLDLDDEQKKLRDAIWDPEIRIVFCNARAGTGKTTVAIGTSILLHDYGVYKGITYIVSPYGEARQGYLPGSITEKSEVYFEPLYQALIECHENPMQCVCNESMVNKKNGSGYVTALTHTYLRGSNLNDCVVVIDEAQNFTEEELRKTLTRTCENSKVVVIGHTGQIDLGNKGVSGFDKCMKHFMSKDDPEFAFCELTHNYRSKVSRVADEPW